MLRFQPMQSFRDRPRQLFIRLRRINKNSVPTDVGALEHVQEDESRWLRVRTAIRMPGHRRGPRSIDVAKSGVANACHISLGQFYPLGGARDHRNIVSVVPICLNKETTGWRSLTIMCDMDLGEMRKVGTGWEDGQGCCISLGQHYPFGGSTGAPRHCLGAPDLLEQKINRLGKSDAQNICRSPGRRGWAANL